jgi:HK97 family phage major capsid protein
MPATGISGAQYDTMFGRPVVPTEYNATMGAVNDVLLADLSQYLLIDKGSVQQAASVHVRFLYDEMTYKFSYRVDGQPLWDKALTPYQGSNTVSPFVNLAVRP